MVGPYRGGRSTAVAGFPDDPDRWLMGSTGGGVWLSTDNGGNWQNLTDGYFGGGIGAVRVAPSDPNVIYVGTGSADIRGQRLAWATACGSPWTGGGPGPSWDCRRRGR